MRENPRLIFLINVHEFEICEKYAGGHTILILESPKESKYACLYLTGTGVRVKLHIFAIVFTNENRIILTQSSTI